MRRSFLLVLFAASLAFTLPAYAQVRAERTR